MPHDLAADLGYTHASGNPLHRVVRWGAGTRAGGWVFSHVLRHLDDVVGRLTKGRRRAPGLLAGLEVLDVTTTGRRSGQRRTSHLIATPYAGGLALLGTNFGQATTPAWALNPPATGGAWGRAGGSGCSCSSRSDRSWVRCPDAGRRGGPSRRGWWRRREGR